MRAMPLGWIAIGLAVLGALVALLVFTAGFTLGMRSADRSRLAVLAGHERAALVARRRADYVTARVLAVLAILRSRV